MGECLGFHLTCKESLKRKRIVLFGNCWNGSGPAEYRWYSAGHDSYPAGFEWTQARCLTYALLSLKSGRIWGTSGHKWWDTIGHSSYPAERSSGFGFFWFQSQFSCFPSFCFCLVFFLFESEIRGREFRVQSPGQGGCTPLFIEGECLGFWNK